MPNIAWFKELNKEKVNLVGGKGASLGEMSNIGLPIPPGFVVTTEAYRKFIGQIAPKIYPDLKKLDVENNDQLQALAKSIQELIIKTEMPQDLQDEITEAYEALDTKDMLTQSEPFVAVRSSANAEDGPEASFAGQNATYLNMKGKQKVLAAVKACWASLFTARSIYYRTKNNFNHTKVFIAVVVQQMVNSEKAGVMFSVNPVSQKPNEIMIEATYGLGESVVSGAITPDEYVVDKNSEEVITRHIVKKTWMFTRDPEKGETMKADVPSEIQEKETLKEHEIKILTQLAKKIEDHYGKPQDMEYAINKERVYIVQSRPITTLDKKEETPKEEVKEEVQTETATPSEVLVKGLSASPGIGSGKAKIVHNPEELNKIEQGDVLVAKMTNPDMVPGMKRASAIVTDAGGSTCHAAIVSREMGIPCVVGTEKATQLIKENQEITVDGTKGEVYSGIIKMEEKKEEVVQEHYEQIETVIDVKVIMDLPDFAAKAAKTGADGVGLLRCEMMMAESGKHPIYLIKNGRTQELIDIVYNGVKKVAQAFEGKPVWYRTSDFRTDEYKNLEGGENEPDEPNPMMGFHGIRRGLEEKELLKAEFVALKKLYDEGFKKIGIMLPMVTHLKQVHESKELLKEVGGEEITFGIMIETPASVQIIEDLCEEGIDFISFGTNDLTQFTLACDRNNAHVQNLYDEMHPAVINQIKHVIRVCRRYNVQTSICGQAGSNPEMAKILVEAGIDSISANTDAVNKIRHIVSKEEKSLLLKIVRRRLEQKEDRKRRK